MIALAALVSAGGVLIINGKLDRLIGWVDTLEAGHHAHVNAVGAHRHG